MKTIDRHTSAAITKFSFLATLLVVMCHTDDVMPIDQKSFLVRFLGGSFTDANVCNFFFLSGFLLARHFSEKGWWMSALKKRILTLAIPYILWCVIYYAIKASLFMHGSAVEPISFINEIRRMFGIGLLTPPCDFALWYVKTLFYFILISPLVFPMLKRSFGVLCLIMGSILLLRLVGYGFKLGLMNYFEFCFHLPGFIAFMCGGLCALHNLSFPERLKKSPPILPLTIWISAALLFFFFGTGIESLSYIAAPINIAIEVFCLLWICFCARWRIASSLVKCTFFIYAAHLMVLKAFARMPAPIITCPIITFGGLFVVSVASCIIGMHAIHYVSPQLAAMLSGGRFDKSHVGRKD